jgi:predicted GNAT superfamily acetyltransferase
VVVRDVTAGDHAAVLALNNGAVPHVNELTEESFAWLAAHADYFRLAEDESGIAGFVLALRSGIEYWSENYAWFSQRFGDFLYLDRAVVATRAHRRGVGRALYTDIATFAERRWTRIVLEVNLRPPNPVSITFHERMGYRRVGVREYDERTKAVVMMERAIAGPSSSARA